MADQITYKNTRVQDDPYDVDDFNAQDSNEIANKFNAAVAEINNNNAKTGITTQQASDIETNNTKVSYDSAAQAEMTANNAKVGITTQQAADIESNNAKVGHIPAKHLSDYDTKQDMIDDQVNQSIGQFYYTTDEEAYWELTAKTGSDADYRGGGVIEETVILALSDYETSIETGTGKAYWIAPWDCTVQSAIGALLKTAPTGASAIFDVNKNGTTMMTTSKIEVEATENSSITATTQPAFTTTAISKGDIISCDIDQVGSTEGGVGASVTLIVIR